ncbi:MAG: hypothetical protein H0U27_10965 [Nitrosopumilus sp.]|nr:hypothetical protein [Nitrosopumilus sp.]
MGKTNSSDVEVIITDDEEGDTEMEDPKQTMEKAKRFKELETKEEPKKVTIKKPSNISPQQWELAISILIENNDNIEWEYLLRKVPEISQSIKPIHSKRQGTIIGFCTSEEKKVKALKRNKKDIYVLDKKVDFNKSVLQISPIIEEEIMPMVYSLMEDIENQIGRPISINFPNVNEFPSKTIIFGFNEKDKEKVENAIRMKELQFNNINFSISKPKEKTVTRYTCNFNIQNGNEKFQEKNIKELEERIYEVTNLNITAYIKSNIKGNYIQVVTKNIEEADKLRHNGPIGLKNWLLTPWVMKKEEEKNQINQIIEKKLSEGKFQITDIEHRISNLENNYKKLDERVQASEERQLQSINKLSEDMKYGFENIYNLFKSDKHVLKKKKNGNADTYKFSEEDDDDDDEIQIKNKRKMPRRDQH